MSISSCWWSKLCSFRFLVFMGECMFFLLYVYKWRECSYTHFLLYCVYICK